MGIPTSQLLCSVVWENNHEEDEDSPVATAQEVNTAVDQALKMGANAFNWLWDGLPPAERVIMSAMAEVKDDVITQEQLIETLNQSGVRLIARELELAPETLMDWELLYRVDTGYRFSVPLLRRWVLANRPLVEEEKWEKIIEICEPLLSQFPGDEVIGGYLETARVQIKTTRKYNEALGALANGMQEQARKLFTEIMLDSPTFGRASLKLVEAMYGKVKISYPIPMAATALTFFTSFLWTSIAIIGLANWMFLTLLSNLSGRWEVPYIYTENFLLLELILIPLMGVLFSFYANHIINLSYQVERGRQAVGRALSAHFLFGMGLFYAARESRRKWLYAAIAALIPAIILARIFYGYAEEYSELKPMMDTLFSSDIHTMDILAGGVYTLLVVYGLSFIDVLYTIRRKQKPSTSTAPSVTTQTVLQSNEPDSAVKADTKEFVRVIRMILIVMGVILALAFITHLTQLQVNLVDEKWQTSRLVQ